MDQNANRQLIYLGSSKKDAAKLPRDVQDIFSEALVMALRGETHENAKPFKHHGSGVFEVVSDYRGDTFRELYTVRYSRVVFVLHIFKKKSKRASETPKEDMELIKKRIKWANEVYEENYGKGKKK
jgi:phage-related protein